LMENVNKPNQCRIVSVSLAISGEVRQMLRQRPIGSKHPQEIDEDADRYFRLLDALDARGSKRQRRNLTKPNIIFFQTNRRSHSGPPSIFSLQPPDSLEKVKSVRLESHLGG
jgi:hypothetical protein